jgi:hypothetical protein
MKPTHRLKVMNKDTSQKAEVGAGWQNTDGSITIQINPCSVLNDDKKYVITLFPTDNKPKT